MDLFDNGEMEEFLLFILNFNMTLADSVTLVTCTKIQYICILFRGYVLHHSDLLYAVVKYTNPLTVETIVLGIDFYFFPVNLLLNQKHVMLHGMRKLYGFKNIQRTTRLIDLNKYLA